MAVGNVPRHDALYKEALLYQYVTCISILYLFSAKAVARNRLLSAAARILSLA